MGRKSNANAKDHISISSENNHVENNENYRKRLRSWKQTSNKRINNEISSPYRSTMYTYPIKLNNDCQSMKSNTVLSENLTTESVFYCPSISYTSIQTTGDLNNNHVTTWNINNNNKRKYHIKSSESLSSQFSQIKTFDSKSNFNDPKNIINNKQSSTNNLQLTYYQNPIKRSRLSTNDSIMTNHRSLDSPLLIDDNTIDINQLDPCEPLLSSIPNESLINNSSSMNTAVKMVQPIVDIIFNAFEDQLKTIQPSQSYSPIMLPYYPLTSPIRPVVLHTVNFNIQLTTKSIEKQNSNEIPENIQLNDNQNLPSTSLNEFRQKIISYIPSNYQTNDGDFEEKTRKLKRIIQLTVIGVSVLCGYLFL